MIAWVDTWLQQWAAEVRGGLPGHCSIQVESAIDIGRELSSVELSEDAWQMECVVRQLAVPLQGLVKIHYLPRHNSTRERVQAAARLLGDRADIVRGAFRGTVEYRAQMDAMIERRKRRYYRLLHDAHEVIAAQLRLNAKAS